MPSTIDVVPFSSFLICSQLRIDVGGLVGDDVAEHVRVPAHELVVDPAGDVGHGELVGLLREHRVEHHLVEEVAQLVFERGVRRGRDRAGARRAPPPPRRTPRAGSG